MNQKLSLFRQALQRREIEAAIVLDEKNIGYLCEYFFTDGLLYIDSQSAYLITDSRYTEEAEKKASSEFSVVMPHDRIAFLRDVLVSHQIRTLGYESRTMTVEQYHTFERGLSVSFAPIGDILSELRAVKTESEISRIKRAQEITDAAYTHILKVLHPSMTEIDVALELSYFMQKSGAEDKSFDIIAVSGEASAYPHGHARNQPLSAGFLTMDFGCIYQNYCSDMTRTVVIGKADAEMKRLYQTVLTAQEYALAAIKEGITCAGADGFARQHIDREGYPGTFGHGLGHGVGLNIHEAPSLSPYACQRCLISGNVVTVEPGIYLTGKYGCRIEDMGVVTLSGFDNFTQSSKELLELF